MIQMRYLAVLACVLCANSAAAGALRNYNNNNGDSSSLQEFALHRPESARTKRSAADDNSATDDIRADYDVSGVVFAKLVLREFIRELRDEKMAAQTGPLSRVSSPVFPPKVARYSDDVSDLVMKRKPFWQPMGGPLPVETRLASFGTKIVPDVSPDSPNRFKGMRYGRR